MIFLANLGFALLGTLFVGAVSNWITKKMFDGDYVARVAAFSVTVGYVVGGYTFAMPPGTGALFAAAKLIGAVIAVVIMWSMLFRTRRNDQT